MAKALAKGPQLPDRPAGPESPTTADKHDSASGRAHAAHADPRMSARGVGQWYEGPGSRSRLAGAGQVAVRMGTGPVRCGGVWVGGWADRRGWMTRNDHWPRMAGERTVVAMQLTTSTKPTPHLGSLIGGTLLGALFVTAGLLVAYLTLETPFVAQLVPGSRTGPSPVGFTTAIWSFALIAGGALLVAGTNRLAITVAHLRSAGVHVSVVARALQGSTLNLAVVRDVTPSDGRVIPELVIGPFGAVVIHELPRPDVIRPASAPATSWEIRTSDGWWPTEHPLDRAARTAQLDCRATRATIGTRPYGQRNERACRSSIGRGPGARAVDWLRWGSSPVG